MKTNINNFLEIYINPDNNREYYYRGVQDCKGYNEFIGCDVKTRNIELFDLRNHKISTINQINYIKKLDLN